MLGYYLKLAMARCARNVPGVLVLALTLAVGVAACMTALTIFRSLSGEPLPGVSEQLYVLTMDAREQFDTGDVVRDGSSSLLKLGDAKALIDAAAPLARPVALAETHAEVGGSDPSGLAVVNGLLAYGPVLHELQFHLRCGRAWSDGEQASRVPVALVDVELAVRLYGTPCALGRTLDVNGRVFRVIGVFSRWKPRNTFLRAAADAPVAENVQLVLPVEAALAAGLAPSSPGDCDADSHAVAIGTLDVARCRWLEVWVALRDAALVAEFRQLANHYAQTQQQAGRFVYRVPVGLYATREWMARQHVLPNDVSLNLILAVAFLVLCVINVSGLLTAVFSRRFADIAVRRALGAARRQIFAQHLVESAMLGMLGGVMALPLTGLGLWIVRQQRVVYAPAANFDAGAFVGLLGLSIAVGLVVGVLPAWRLCRLAPGLRLKQSE